MTRLDRVAALRDEIAALKSTVGTLSDALFTAQAVYREAAAHPARAGSFTHLWTPH